MWITGYTGALKYSGHSNEVGLAKAMKLARPNDPEHDMFGVDTAPSSGNPQACHTGVTGGTCQAGNWDCKSYPNYPLGQKNHLECNDA